MAKTGPVKKVVIKINSGIRLHYWTLVGAHNHAIIQKYYSDKRRCRRMARQIAEQLGNVPVEEK